MIKTLRQLKNKLQKGPPSVAFLPSVALAKDGAKPGQILVLALIFMAVLTILITSLYSRLAVFLASGKRSYSSEYALNLAEAGLDYALSQLNATDTWTGPIIITLGIGQFEVTAVPCVSSIGVVNKCIISTGYWPDATNPKYQQQVKVVAIPADTSQYIVLPYGLMAKSGGIDLSGTYVKSNNVTNHWSSAYTYGSLSGIISAAGKICGYGYGSGISAPNITFACNAGDGSPPNPPTYTQISNCPATCAPFPSVNYDYVRQHACTGIGGKFDTTNKTCDRSTPSSSFISTCTGTPPTITISSGLANHIGSAVFNCSNVVVNTSGTLYIDGDVWITGTLKVAGSGSVKTYSNSPYNATIAPSILADSYILIQSNVDRYSNSGSYPYLWILGSKSDCGLIGASSTCCITANADILNTVLYCPNGLIQISSSLYASPIRPVAVAANQIQANTTYLVTSNTFIYDSVLGLPGGICLSGCSPPITYVVQRGSYIYQKSL